MQTLWLAVGITGSLSLLNLALILAVIRRINIPQRDFMDSMIGLPPGEPVPSFTADLLGGGALSQTEISGQPNVLLFVTPECKACIRAMPDYLRLARLAESRGPGLIFVSGGDADATLRMFGRSGTRVLITPTEESDVFKRFQVPGTPHFVLIADDKVHSSGFPDPLNRGWRSILSNWENHDSLARGLVNGRIGTAI